MEPTAPTPAAAPATTRFWAPETSKFVAALAILAIIIWGASASFDLMAVDERITQYPLAFFLSLPFLLLLLLGSALPAGIGYLLAFALTLSASYALGCAAVVAARKIRTWGKVAIAIAIVLFLLLLGVDGFVVRSVRTPDLSCNVDADCAPVVVSLGAPCSKYACANAGWEQYPGLVANAYATTCVRNVEACVCRERTCVSADAESPGGES